MSPSCVDPPLRWDKEDIMTTKGRQERCKRKWQELGSIEKLSRIEDDTTPLNMDQATPQDLYLPIHL
jgi:hypothetical protein